ncbi:NMDA receptor-regulated protein 1-domain-containing protein [Podospora fimiseda]|uniref:NMDA receptor-regulated protein 1-domain-containing protein n=1 Tax=Podospora fimiseda TaxID=252190 RepID=A0AAN7BQ26_9PEZI|nr:NMDA receptor-regulated protein 1-domain-containing protein [Podospora fimiseda]
MPQPLSTREANLFRSVIRHYEDKQYKRGLKAAEQILKKHPKHGDTMSMKALIMNAQGKTEEAFALAKEALKVDMRSHICWHVYGILYRTNKNFDEAIKAYKFALKLEPESHQIQRDLAILQVQMRDYPGYVQSRFVMLKARPQLRQNWTALAIAYHLDGNLQQAENILTTYEKSITTPPPKTDLENSEALLYKNSIIAEQGEIERALEHLEKDCKNCLDRVAVMELRARYLSELGRKEEAAKAYRALLDRNPDHSDYYKGLVAVLDLAADDEAGLKAVYDEYASKYPRCDAARRLPLDFLTGDGFRTSAKAYLTLMFDKGVPSTFANLKHLYSDSFKKETLPEIAEEYLQERKSSEAASSDSSKGEGAALYFLAQHYNYYLSRDLDKALEYVEKAIQLDPKSVDFQMTKARIFKHQGDLAKASEAMDQARLLDVKDRYINSKAAKYQLRNDENEKALTTLGLFTRAETVGGPLVDLVDMQAMWFLTEDGETWQRRGNVGLALKRFHTIFNIFDIWQEDQFDFHAFSLRKGQIRAYVEMIRWEDKIRDHPFYFRAALDAVNIYLALHDKPQGANGANGSEGNGDDAAEKKKAAKKAKKEAQKAEREAAERALKQDPNKQKAKETEEPKKKDDDPNGTKLAATQDPLGDAMKFLGPLLEFSPKNIEGQIAGFEVYVRRSKYLPALRCLKAALALNKDHPKVLEQASKFHKVIANALDSLSPKVQEVIKAELSGVPDGGGKNNNVVIPYYNVLWAEVSEDTNWLQIDYAHQDKPHHLVVKTVKLAVSSEEQQQGEDGGLGNWVEKLLDKAYEGPGVKRRKRGWVLVNPHAGPGGAERIWEREVKPIFEAARMDLTVVRTTYSGEGVDLAQVLDVDKYDVAIPCSGDGLPHEVFNGLGNRKDAKQALSKIAVCHIPCGSGNAMSCNLYGTHRPSLAALGIVKGVPTRLDLVSVTQGGERKLSFLSQALGVIADCDLGTEHLRWMGGARFTVGFLGLVFQKKTYPCDLAVKVEIEHKEEVKKHYRERVVGQGAQEGAEQEQPEDFKGLSVPDTPVSRDEDGFGEEDVGLPPLKYGTDMDKLPEGWELIPHENLGSFYCGNMAYMAPDANFFSAALANDGLMDLVTTDGDVSPFKSISLQLAVDSGEFFDSPLVTYRKVSAYRIIPRNPGKGYISIDGEAIPFQAFQAEIHQGLGLTLSKKGVFEAPGPLNWDKVTNTERLMA